MLYPIIGTATSLLVFSIWFFVSDKRRKTPSKGSASPVPADVSSLRNGSPEDDKQAWKQLFTSIRNKDALHGVKVSVVVLLFLLYSKVVRATFAVFHIHPEGLVRGSDGGSNNANGNDLEYYLANDFSQVADDATHRVSMCRKCASILFLKTSPFSPFPRSVRLSLSSSSSSSSKGFQIIGIMSMVLYVIGIPVMGLALLFSKRRKLHSPGTWLKYGFLVSCYCCCPTTPAGVSICRAVALCVLLV